ncbi:MAG: ATP-binding protein [Deltaproteobacteria bacterium]|nr:ATP-binding protein [Deltaproteobacteria bacterium]
MIPRSIAPKLRSLASTFPVVTVTGPRQSGKTTLCRAAFPDHAYVSLERPDVREHAVRDPLDFLHRLGDRAILDEVQRAPDLLSYLQVEVDRHRAPGRFVLTGSHNFLLIEGVSQSLAGRTALLRLLPLSLDEVRRFPAPPRSLDDVLWTGGYPAIYQEGHAPGDWLAAYVATYLERDVRSLQEIRDLRAFQTFLGLCAGRTAQVLNLSALCSDAGVSAGTARAWLGILEASFVVTLVPGWSTNLRKRLIRSPKLHFLDSGLCAWLLGIRSPGDLALHHARGALFESWIVAEILKSRYARGLPADLHHVRNQKGEEIDLLVDDGVRRTLVEVKAGRTVSGDAFRPLHRWQSLLGDEAERGTWRRILVHGGEEASTREGIEVVPWADLPGRIVSEGASPS